jgi:hypothetical protein
MAKSAQPEPTAMVRTQQACRTADASHSEDFGYLQATQQPET